MNDSSFLFTRRDFLKSAALAGAAMSLPNFLTNSVSAAIDPATGAPGFKDDRLLIVIQMGGGNDGLNTIVPYSNDVYHALRPRLALKKDKILTLNDDLGMHGGMTGFKELYDAGELAIVNGVGYPDPDQSHFRSMEIWQTAVDSNRYSNSGWIGRYFESTAKGGKVDPLVAVNIGEQSPQAFDSRSDVGVSFTDPGRFQWNTGKNPDARPAFETLNKIHAEHHEERTIDFLRHTTANAILSSDRVQKAARVKRQAPQYPPGRLTNSLRSIANMISAGLPTRVYYASITGFDTHSNQLGQQERLLTEIGAATAAFWNDLKAIGVADRTMIMAFSEFGRRAGENASGGTDHGTAGPMFLVGKNVNPGVHGAMPSLTDLDNGNLKYTVDFRSVYSEVLTKWLKAETKPVVGREFPLIGALRA